MRFVFLIRDLEHNGPSGSRIRFAEALAERGHTAEILTLSSLRRRHVPPGVKVTTLETPATAAASGRRRQSLLIASLRQWFVAETSALPIDFLSSSLTGTNQLVHLSGIRHTHHWLHIPVASLRLHHGSWWKRWRRRRVDRQTYDRARVIGVSQGVIDDLARLGAKPSEAELIYNCFNIDRVKALAAEAIPAQDLPARPYIVHAARFADVKRHDLLFEAFKVAKLSHRLVLLTEDNPALRSLISRFGLEGQVVVAGFRQNPYPVIAGADALVLCSDMEGFPNVLVESLIVGTPVISTDCLAGPADILTGPYRRWLSPPGDVTALAANLADIVANPYAIETWLYERFSMDKAIEKLEQIAEREPHPSL